MGKKANFKREYTEMLSSQTHFGESKHLAKQKALKEAKEQDISYQPIKGIYSKQTYKTYSKACEQFSSYLREYHPEIKKFKDGEKYISEWLHTLDKHSAWTINTYGSGVACAFHLDKTQLNFQFPKRQRADITRSRDPVISYRDTSPKYEDAIIFAKATGARRCGIMRVTVNDLRQRDDGTYEVFLREKNNMSGWRQVLPQYQEQVLDIFKNSHGYKTENNEIRLFAKNSLPSELHHYRGEYVCDLYRYYEELGIYTNEQKYHCRGDMAGLSFDRGILEAVSNQVFHHRLDVIVNNYLYNYK